ncbi:MAG: branched-chain amino acid ABC transporter permease, partial [Chloroflexota bacterium]|nr:branched-chain amino acid ABC transporter permease [Chloroflexota bacterium]
MLPSGTYNVSYRQDMAIVRTRLQWVLLILGLIALFIVPRFATGYGLSILNGMGIMLISVHGLNLLTGYTGQISLGQAGFMAVGAYSSALLVDRAGVPFLLALPLSGLIAGLVGLLFGLPSVRIKGFYLAMATLAAQFIIPWVIVHVRSDLTGGSSGIVVSSASIGDVVLKSQESMYYLVMVVAVLMTWMAKNLARTHTGRAFVAIRDNDIAAESMGINLFAYKLLAFFICSFYAGIAGSLWAHWMRAINPDHFTLMDSIWYVGMVIVGGMGSTAGAVFGTVSLRLLRELVMT